MIMFHADTYCMLHVTYFILHFGYTIKNNLEPNSILVWFVHCALFGILSVYIIIENEQNPRLF